MKHLDKILLIILLLVVIMPVFAADDANLSAQSLVLEETEDGVSIILEGPVEIAFNGDILTADSAIVLLGEDLSSLDAAIVSIELTGDVRYSGSNGASGRAGRAVYYSQGRRIVLMGGAHFSRGDLNASAGTVEYSVESRRLNISGNCSIGSGDLSATSGTAEYNLDEETGNLSGDVIVRYFIGKPLIGDEVVDEIVMRSEALYISVAEGKIQTPTGPEGGRTTIDAGDFSLVANSVIFQASESGISQVTAEGNVSLSGPDLQYLNAGNISISTSDRVLLAEGGVEFSVMGQEGSAESIEVNFAEGWSIRLVGGSIGGAIDESLINGETVDREDDGG